MSNWLDCLVNPEPIQSVFRQVLPLLVAVDLHEVKLDRDGPEVMLRFDFSEYPESPPEKWKKQGYNCVQVKLKLIGVRRLFIDGWSTNCQIDLEVGKINDHIQLTSLNGPTKIQVISDIAMIGGISAYQDAEKIHPKK